MSAHFIIIAKIMEALEYEFKRHEPEIQAFIIDQLNYFLSKSAEWIETKLQGDKDS